jgi:hypothetical protein
MHKDSFRRRVPRERAVLVLEFVDPKSASRIQHAQRADGAWFARCLDWRRCKSVWGEWRYVRAPGRWLPGAPIEATAFVPSPWREQPSQVFEFHSVN